MGLGWRATLFSVGVMGPWALAHWEEYHSGSSSEIIHLQHSAADLKPVKQQDDSDLDFAGLAASCRMPY